MLTRDRERVSLGKKLLGLRGTESARPPNVLSDVELAMGLKVCTGFAVAVVTSSHELTPLVVESVQLSDRLLLVPVVWELSLLSLRSPFSPAFPVPPTSRLLAVFSPRDVSVPESRLPPKESDLSFDALGTESRS